MLSEQEAFKGLSDGQIGIGLLVHLIALTLILLSVGCVEVRDPDSAKPSVQADAVAEWDLKVDKVLILNSEEEAQKLSQVTNLLLEKGGVVVTNGFRLSLHLQNLESHGGKIITFPKNQTAANQQLGRSGGLIEIKSESAVGELYVEMRGERGGPGVAFSPPGGGMLRIPGPPYPGLQGGQGGDSGFLQIEIHSSTLFHLMDLHEPGVGAAAGPENSPYPGSLPGNRGSTCFIENGKRSCQ